MTKTKPLIDARRLVGQYHICAQHFQFIASEFGKASRALDGGRLLAAERAIAAALDRLATALDQIPRSAE